MFRLIRCHQQFSFLLVGGSAFLVDSLVFWLLFTLAEVGIYIARIVAFSVAVLITWYGNRTFTFKARQKTKAKQQIIRAFVGALISLIPNLAVFAALVPFFPFGLLTYIPFCAGIIAGTVSNFILSDKFVFT
ncbi:GtrA family protein [Vibrio sp. MA40-2]|uniref:GtrA family protein n=1 Tax=Vibrio sp. MA40-2 TaxID=3391828 RepID=UPI0039A5978D